MSQAARMRIPPIHQAILGWLVYRLLCLFSPTEAAQLLQRARWHNAARRNEDST